MLTPFKWLDNIIRRIKSKLPWPLGQGWLAHVLIGFGFVGLGSVPGRLLGDFGIRFVGAVIMGLATYTGYLIKESKEGGPMYDQLLDRISALIGVALGLWFCV